MNADERFCKTVKWRTWRRREPASRLGDTVVRFMENRVERQFDRFEGLEQVWNELLGDYLARRCRIVGLTGGKLEVQADSPVHRHQLMMRKAEFLRTLAKRCRASKIRDIRVRL